MTGVQTCALPICRERRLGIREVLGPERDLPGDALDDREQVLRSMRQLAHDEAKMLLVALALGDVGVGLHDRCRRAVRGPAPDPMTLRKNLRPGLGVLHELALPAAVAQEDLLD